MTEAEFRFKHSEIIECYQNIEMRLKGICAALDAEKEIDWFHGLDDHESDPLGKLLLEIHVLQQQRQMEFLKPEDFQGLDNLRQARNYWVHQCFAGNNGGISFKQNGELKKSEYGKRLRRDLHYAEEWEEKITKIGHSVLFHLKELLQATE